MPNLIKKLKAFMKNLFLPDQNTKLPLAYTTKALIAYALIAMFSVAIFLPFYNTRLNFYLASLTQDVIISEVNPAREIENLMPLTSSPLLNQAAQMKAQDMIDRNYFSHNDPDGKRPWQWLDKVGYKYALAGENLAKDFFEVDPLVAAWLNSPSHAKNILNNYFTEIGIGIATGDMNGQQTTVVAMFVAHPLTPTIQTLAVQSGETILDEPQVVPQPQPQPEPEPILQPPQPQPESQEEPGPIEPELNNETPLPEKLFVVQRVSNALFKKEAGIIRSSAQGQQTNPEFQAEVSESTHMKASLLSKVPNMIKMALGLFFATLLVWLFIATYVFKKSLPHFTQRSLALVILIIILWI